MAFDGDGTITKNYFASGSVLANKLTTIIWSTPVAAPVSWAPLSRAERAMLDMLNNSSLSQQYLFYSNVPLYNIFAIDARRFIRTYKKKRHWTSRKYAKSIRRSAYIKLNQQIGRKAVDILVCSRASGAIVGGIEVDGKHHSKEKQRNWDFSKSMMFAMHDLPLLRLSTKNVRDLFSEFRSGKTRALHDFLGISHTNWKAFADNPSVETMQLHKP